MLRQSAIVAIVLGSLCLGLHHEAQASDASLSVSVGSGYSVEGDGSRIPTNLMVAPGFNLLGDNFLRFEVGFVADMPDVRNGNFDLQLRPMLVLTAPIIPVYGRLVGGVTQLVHGPVQTAFGGVVGIEAPCFSDSHIFAEAGYVPRATRDAFLSVFEGRLGLRFGF
ncbi:MAG TPA: hypothetical protein VFH51_16080 [Myxococcota bacterium]|nr:hypothetical protein [Myxococcota bacterium]